MKKKVLGFVIAIVAVIALVFIGIFIFGNKPSSTSNVIYNSNNYSMHPMMRPQNFTGMQLSSSPLSNYAYLISSGSLSPESQEAITGFNLTSVMNSDGSTTYTLTALKQGYYNQSYTVQPSQSLYFIERSMGDDNVADDDDYNLGDDFAIIVDSNGYIIQGPNSN